MPNERILYVCQEMTPYLPDSTISSICRTLPQLMQEADNQIRLFTPRYGLINERRGQLHEVIRLSGMNIIIDDNDHQLIIKVASIPGARLQVYFIDNDDYFQRKAIFEDTDGSAFADNDERAIFFARGVLETVKKLRWSPTVVHCHGWISAIIPAYLKRVFKDDPIFSKLKIVISTYNDEFATPFQSDIAEKLNAEGITRSDLTILENHDYTALMQFALQYADGVVIVDQPNETLTNYIKERNIPILTHPQSENYASQYDDFYASLTQN